MTFCNHFQRSIILVTISRNIFRIHSMSMVTTDRCLCVCVKKSHTEKEIKVNLRLYGPFGFLMHLDGILQDSSAKGPLLYVDFNQRFKLSNSILQTRESVVQIKAAKASTELTKGDKKSILVSGFLNNGFLPLTSLQRQCHFLFPCFKDQR